jgi:very-short-patch-repair endonuclease
LPFRFAGNGDVFVGRKNPDFVASDGSKVAIEVFYRRHKDQFRGGVDVWRSEREAVFNEHGWRIIFFDETQVHAERVKAALGGVLSQQDFG